MRAVTLLLAFAAVATPQGRPVDWPSYGGDARRTGWERSDVRITKDNVKDFQLVLKRKLDNGVLTPPVVIGLLISYRGFKELGFVASSSGNVWAIDLDLNKVFWQKRFEARASAAGPCAASVSTPALTPPTIFGRRPGMAKPAVAESKSPGLPPTPAGRTTERAVSPRVGGGGFGAPRPVYVMAGDGMLHQVNTSDGSDQFPPLKFLPANAKASSLTMHDNVMYTTTSSGCGGAPNAVWALDLRDEEPKPASHVLKGGEAGGLGGFALGNDGTVYVPAGPELHALSPGDLQPRASFAVSGGNSTPVVFEYKGRDVIVSAGKDGRLYVLDSRAVGTPLSQTIPVGSVWGGLSSWEDADGTRWVAAPVWGAVSPELKAPITNGTAPNGSIVAFRLDEQNGAPVLVPAWVSRDLNSPVPPVITSGVVFALSTKGRAVLYGFDGATGKEMYSSGNQISAPAALTGLTVANGRVFFTTTDGTLYGFGIYLEI
jgi:outer membrane protein assembly factor BamB